MTEAFEMTGGCQCGTVRYRVTIRDDEAYAFHCGMCRRATGGAMAALKNVRQADVIWDGEPRWHRSSPIAERPFCGTCGTPLGFRFVEGSDTMDLTIGSFDDPGRFRPTSQFAIEKALPGWSDVGNLKGMRLDEHAALVARWEKAGGVPD